MEASTTESFEQEAATWRSRLLTAAKVRLPNVLMALGTFFGLWLLVQQLVGLQGIGDTLKAAIWGWAILTLVATQLTNLTEAIAISGTLPIAVPIGPLTMLRFALAFTGLIGGTLANTATIIRFNQRRGLDAAIAVSSGIIYSVSGFIVQLVILVVFFIFFRPAFAYHAEGPSGSGAQKLELALFIFSVVGLVTAVLTAIPKVRAIIRSRASAHFRPAWRNLRIVLRSPSRTARIFGGAAASQVLFAVGLGLALRSVGAQAPLGGLIVVCTLTSLVGGLAPVPGGIGIMESCYIFGLTLLGVPQELAISATVIFRVATTYLPPLWGWGALVWLRRTKAF
jgi:uncharacterized membrane protein YbhN (UPF0104 family)